MEKLNKLVTTYKETREEKDFNEIYAEVIGFSFGKYEKIGKSIVATGHEALALYEDTLLKCIETYDERTDFEKYFSFCVRTKRSNLLESKKYRKKHEDYSVDSDDENAAMFEIVDDFNLAEEVVEGFTRKKKNDQRMLIESLVSGENERTTAIVQTYLSTELKTPTAIGKHLGLDHKQVSRALNRLAGKFSTKQFGNYRDYLVAL